LTSALELTIKELCEEILSEQDPQALPAKIIDHVQRAFPVEWSTLWLTEQKGATGDKQLRLVAASNSAGGLMTADDGRPAVYSFGEGLTGDIAEGRTTVNIKEPADFTRFNHARKYDQVMYQRASAGELCRCVLGVPLLLRSKSPHPASEVDEWRVIGVLKLENIKSTPVHLEPFFTDSDSQIVEAYAAVIAVALEKARLRDNSVRIGLGLMEISKNLLERRGDHPDVDSIVKETANVISAEACALWLRRGMHLWPVACSGYPGGKEGAAIYHLQVGESPQADGDAEAMLSPLEQQRRKYQGCGLTVFVANTQTSLNLKTAREVTGHFAWKGANDRPMWNKPNGQACYSLVAIPLIDQETKDLKGVFKIENKKPTIFQLESYFTDEDERLLSTLGNAISLSLITSERFQRLERLERLIGNLRVLEGEDEALFFLLTGLTHGAGLAYNRAMIFLRDRKDPRRLGCSLAIGHVRDEDWSHDMTTNPPEQPLNLDRLVHEFRTRRKDFISSALMEMWGRQHIWIDDTRQVIGIHAARNLDTQKYISGDLGENDCLKGFAHGDFVLIPIRIEGSLQGIIYADNRFTGNRINKFECHVLDLFAGMAGAIITASEVPQKVRQESQQAWRMIAQPAAHRLGTEAKIISDATTATLQYRLEERLNRAGGQAVVPIASDVVRECLQPVAQSVERLRHAALAYREAAAEPEELQDFDLCGLIQEVINTTTNEMNPVRAEANFPKGPVVIKARRQRLKYVFEELILNALKEAKEASEHSQREPRPIRVLFEVRSDGISVRCRVCDDGRGIPATARAKLFKQRAGGRQGGAGLGMVIINRTLKESGGSIVVSDVGKPDTYAGACFVITLPVIAHSAPTSSSRDAHEFRAASDGVQLEPPLGLPVRSDLPVMVVEDTDYLRAMLCDRLRRQGLDVREARNEYEAIGKASVERIGAIIADINLSEGGGQERGGLALAEQLKRLGLKIPIVLISQNPFSTFPSPLSPEYDSTMAQLNVSAVLDRLPNTFDEDLDRVLARVLTTAELEERQ
jgi:CheY-like chemotaxis protein